LNWPARQRGRQRHCTDGWANESSRLSTTLSKSAEICRREAGQTKVGGKWQTSNPKKGL